MFEPTGARPLVVIDADVLGRQRTGDETHVRELLRWLPQVAPDLHFGALTRLPELVPRDVRPISLRTPSQGLRMAVAAGWVLRRIQPDLIHFLHALPLGWRGPSVLTIPDLSFERREDTMSRTDRTIFRTVVPRAISRATVVTTVSEFTKNDIVDCYGTDPSKIHVIHNGVDDRFTPDGPRVDGRGALLFVGARQPRKDPETAIRALTHLPRELRLVMIGPSPWGDDDLTSLIAQLGLEDRVKLLGHVELSELAAWYRSAECLVFPSLYEGFGLPVLEAMASGTPVVAAQTTAIPEVAGTAAALVEPSSPEALAAGIRRVLAERDEWARRAIERAAAFSWHRSARDTAEVYAAVLRASTDDPTEPRAG